MEEISHNNLPKAVSLLSNEVKEIKELVLLLLKGSEHPPPQEDICTIKEASEITGLAVSTIYSLNHKSIIPCFKRGGILRFSRKRTN